MMLSQDIWVWLPNREVDPELKVQSLSGIPGWAPLLAPFPDMTVQEVDI